MALTLKSQNTFGGLTLPVRPPLPDGAAGYADFCNGVLQISPTDAAVGPLSNIVCTRNALPAGWYYGKDGLALGQQNYFDRIEYDAQGAPIGLRIDAQATHLVTAANRIDLTTGTLSGATIAADGTPANAWAQWYRLTAAGGAAAYVAMPTGAAASGNYVLMSWEVKSAAARYVQIGALNGGATCWANVDLLSREVTAKGDGVTAGVIARPGGSCTVWAALKLSAAASDLGLYVAPVQAGDAGKLATATAAADVLARLPTAITSSSLDGLYLPSPWPQTASSVRGADAVGRGASMPAGTADFTLIYRFRSRPDAVSRGSGLLLLSSAAGGTGSSDPFAELRFASDGVLCLVYNAARQHEFATPWAPDTVFRFGVSRKGSQLSVVINDEAATLDLGSYGGGNVLTFKGQNSNLNTLGGHLQKCLWWAEACSQADLAARVDHWL